MTVKVDRFDPDAVPDHKRPRVMQFTAREGSLSVHCSRENGSLWIFATGPAGGDRGTMTVPVARAGDLLTWVGRSGERGAFQAGGASLSLRGQYPGVKVAEGERLLVVSRSTGRRVWRMRMDSEAADELLRCLVAWAKEAERGAAPERVVHENGDWTIEATRLDNGVRSFELRGPKGEDELAHTYARGEGAVVEHVDLLDVGISDELVPAETLRARAWLYRVVADDLDARKAVQGG